MSIGRYTKHIELYNVMQYYIAAHASDHPKSQPWPRFDDFIVLQSGDQAGVVFSQETALFGDGKQLQENEAIGKNIANRLIECASYFLAQPITPETVPDELRICLAICHADVHWTSVIATASSFRAFYRSLYSQYIVIYGDQPNHSVSEIILRNRALDVINDTLQITFNTGAQRIRSILDQFKTSPISIAHYDSLNGYCDRRVDDSLQKLVDEKYIAGARHLPCSRQHGNTCGDHTVMNLFGMGMLGIIPIINDCADHDAEGITSTSLRAFTDLVLEDTGEQRPVTAIRLPLQEAARTLLARARAHALPSAVATVDTDMLKSSQLTALESLIVEKVNKLAAFHIDSPDMQWTTYCVNAAVNAAKSETDITQCLIDFEEHYDGSSQPIVYNEIKQIAQTLKEIFAGVLNDETREIFKHISSEDCVAYGSLAQCIARDRCVQIEHDALRQGKSLDALNEQIDTFKRYEKAKASYAQPLPSISPASVPNQPAETLNNQSSISASANIQATEPVQPTTALTDEQRIQLLSNFSQFSKIVRQYKIHLCNECNQQKNKVEGAPTLLDNKYTIIDSWCDSIQEIHARDDMVAAIKNFVQNLKSKDLKTLEERRGNDTKWTRPLITALYAVLRLFKYEPIKGRKLTHQITKLFPTITEPIKPTTTKKRTRS